VGPIGPAPRVEALIREALAEAKHVARDGTDIVAPDVETLNFAGTAISTSSLINTAPVITSAAMVAFAEGGTGAAHEPTATDAEGNSLIWSLSGTDAALFDMDATSGAVTFKAAPDFEAPADAGGDNVCDITVTASDGTLGSAGRDVPSR
jgi:hypothetical protein